MSKSVKAHRKRTGLSKGSSEWVKNHIEDLDTLPHPKEEWTTRDVDLEGIRVDNLVDMGVIDKVGSKKTTTAGTHRKINLYRTTQVGYDAIVSGLKDLEENGFTPCPCSHRGVTNLGDGEYGCLNDDCGEVYTRDEVDV